MSDSMQTINISSLPSAESRAVRLGLFWRGAVIVVLSNIAAALIANTLGLAIGNAMASAGQQVTPGLVTVLTVAGAVLSVSVSAAFLMLYVRWLMAAKFNGCRLAFVSANIQRIV